MLRQSANNFRIHMMARMDKYIVGVLLCTCVLVCLSVIFLKPQFGGDSSTYVQSMYFLQTGQKTAGFFPNRLITTIGGLELIIFFSKYIRLPTRRLWLVMNILCYFISSITFYLLLVRIFQSKKTALLGTLFLIGNYAYISFALSFLMDVGGWMFYILSLYFLFKYVDSCNVRICIVSQYASALGGLFKEYALLGAIPICIFLIYKTGNVSVNW